MVSVAGRSRALGGDEVALFNPQHLATHTGRRWYNGDIATGRIVCVKRDYRASETVRLNGAAVQASRRPRNFRRHNVERACGLQVVDIEAGFQDVGQALHGVDTFPKGRRMLRSTVWLMVP